MEITDFSVQTIEEVQLPFIGEIQMDHTREQILYIYMKTFLYLFCNQYLLKLYQILKNTLK